MKIISFLVDALPDHYYKAELLLFSLEKFANVSKEQILVQCTNRVDQVFLSFLERSGYHVCIIKPYLDRKYCNKIMQLDVFVEKECDGVFLLDVDMFVLSPLIVGDRNCVWGKVVDAPNPPLEILENIFKKANVSLPAVVDADWLLDNAKTIETNFNGGFYYIPSRYILKLRKLWKKWAEWLYSKPELFETQRQRNHIDQISMAMSLAESDIIYKTLPANYNYPTHYDIGLRSYVPCQKISVLHYHQLITPFGLLNEQIVSNEGAQEAISTANRAISRKGFFEFFEGFKRASVVPPEKNEARTRFSIGLMNLLKPIGRRLNLILHVGTPKTGTTSLQFFMDGKHDQLLARGILYPQHYSNTYAPKHQWLVTDLMNANADGLLKDMEVVLSGVKTDTHTVFLSTEGIFNHWWDMPIQSKGMLAELASLFDISIWVWFREPLSFAESFYRQNLKNPQMEQIKCYGRDMSLEDMLSDEWFVRHLDYPGFLYECEAIFGSNSVVSLFYEGDTIAAACEKLGFPFLHDKKIARENTGLSVAAKDILRIINRYSLKAEEKKSILPYVEKLNIILSAYSIESISDSASRNMVADLTALTQKIMK